VTETASAFRLLRATMEHLDVLAPLFDAYRQFYRQPPDVDAARRYLNARLVKNEAVLFLALDAGGAGLGFTLLYPTFSSIAMKPHWVLNDLYVVPEARQQGVARALMQRAQKFAAETGAEGLSLETAADNLAAQRLYEKLGWKRDEEYYRYALHV
jgi:ribosomal protein S18 acetylase RimI-like enzyme